MSFWEDIINIGLTCFIWDKLIWGDNKPKPIIYNLL